ncbi:hypothetical protein C8Q80DRAFT_605089 [Daedaleopsis nitida]|nr:hypothetical protein C8Q80DRAFT_605089 [Daedaleopsis nitida]
MQASTVEVCAQSLSTHHRRCVVAQAKYHRRLLAHDEHPSLTPERYREPENSGFAGLAIMRSGRVWGGAPGESYLTFVDERRDTAPQLTAKRCVVRQCLIRRRCCVVIDFPSLASPGRVAAVAARHALLLMLRLCAHAETWRRAFTTLVRVRRCDGPCAGTYRDSFGIIVEVLLATCAGEAICAAGCRNLVPMRFEGWAERLSCAVADFTNLPHHLSRCSALLAKTGGGGELMLPPVIIIALARLSGQLIPR